MALNAAGVINNCNPRERLRNSTLVRSEGFDPDSTVTPDTSNR
jgi:hypothetical protein